MVRSVPKIRTNQPRSGRINQSDFEEAMDGPDLGGWDRPCPAGRTWIVDTAVKTEGGVILLTRRFPGLMVCVAGNSTYMY